MKLLKTLFFCGAALGAQISYADWNLVADESRLSFVSVKNDAVGEVHRFKGLSGTVSEDGTAELMIELGSVDTAIALRDQRMQDELFETKQFQQAKVTLAFDQKKLAALKTGDTADWRVDYQLMLHGKVVPAKAEVSVSRLANNGLLVTTVEPILVNAAEFDMTGGVDKLKQLAGLKNIAYSVPVTFTLTFAAQEQ